MIARGSALLLLLALLTPAAAPQVDAQNQPVTTGDGAWTWQNPQPQGNDLWGVRFADASNGWAVGRRGLVMHTGDGSNSWQIQDGATTEDLFAIATADAN